MNGAVRAEELIDNFILEGTLQGWWVSSSSKVYDARMGINDEHEHVVIRHYREFGLSSREVAVLDSRPSSMDSDKILGRVYEKCMRLTYYAGELGVNTNGTCCKNS